MVNAIIKFHLQCCREFSRAGVADSCFFVKFIIFFDPFPPFPRREGCYGLHNLIFIIIIQRLPGIFGYHEGTGLSDSACSVGAE